ncbi:MAG: exodeoxyribonuclease V alpha subunit [Saprospiraceae bacterium]|jgi:exodeoxyribonuclease V alpha subunit
MEEIKGYIERITFQNAENGWTVARMKVPKNYDLTTIVGNMPTIQVGETIRCKGHWHNDKNFGYQFQVKDYEVEQPSTITGIKKYLGSGLVKGIGNVFADRIVTYFGEGTLDVIDTTPDELLKVSGIGKKRIEKIKSCWAEQKSIREVMIYLQKLNVSPAFAQKIFKRYGDESIFRIEQNPYDLAKDIWGIGFKTADKIAQNMNISKDSDIRIDAGVEYVLSELSSNGHTCFPVEKFTEEAAKLLEVKPEQVQSRLEEIALENRIVLSNLVVKTVNSQPATRNSKELIPHIWLQAFYISEVGIAKEIKRLQNGKTDFRKIENDNAVEWAEEKMEIQLAENQKLAVKTSFTEKVHIITGGPGTGKSTITKVILAVMKKLTDKILLAAPTGRAAKRMAEITKMEAKTIHALLKFDFKINGFTHNREKPLDCDLIIIDEASMLDTILMYSLLKAIPTTARVIFVGDIDQLPSVGAGNVLNDLIQSKVIPITRLTDIFRQAASSKIITNAHRINAGVFPDIDIDKDSDFFFVEEEDTEKIVTLIGDLVATRLPKRYGFNRLTDIQVLSPMNRGIVGNRGLNEYLQKRLNPSTNPLVKLGRSFDVNDKVMQIVNNYDKEVFNGDVGRITKIDRIEQEIHVEIDKKNIIYEFSEIDQLVLAYSVSIHKYQGSECPCVVIPIHTTHYNLLFRNLVYTGITRGKKLVILVGTKRALHIAVNNNQVAKRYTGLQQAILVEFSKNGGSDLDLREILKLEF